MNLSTDSFMPHGHCYLWTPEILWTHVVSDVAIGIAYFTIPFGIYRFLQLRKDVKFKGIYYLFISFIIACGITHLFSVYTTWVPSYFIEGFIKFITAAISIFAAIAVWRYIPAILSFPTFKEFESKTKELEELNKKLEEKVRERVGDSYRLASIFNSSNDAISIKDLNGYITDWNPSCERLYGFTKEEAIGKHIDDFVPENSRELLKRLGEKVKKGFYVKPFDTERLSKSGIPIEVSLSLSPVFNENGEVCGVSSIAQNIGDRKEIERRILNERNKLDRVLNLNTDGWWEINFNKNKESSISNNLKQTLGYQTDDIKGTYEDWKKLIFPEDLKELEKYIESHTNSDQEKPFHQKIRYLTKDGNFIWMICKGVVFKSDNNKVQNIIGVNFNVTKLIDLEMELRQANRDLQLRTNQMEQFIYTISHDLKSPLVTSQGFLGFLKEDISSNDQEKISDSLRRLESANNRMIELINDLLELSRVGHLKAEFQEVDSYDLIKSIIENIRNDLDFKGVINLKNNLPTLICDPLKFKQALENLIRNAVYYGKSKNGEVKVEVAAKESDSHFIFEVTDSGKGIEKEYQSSIFELFNRLDHAKKVKSEGTGVGLAIVQRVAEIHNGSVWVKSKIGNGSKFMFSISKNLVKGNEITSKKSSGNFEYL